MKNRTFLTILSLFCMGLLLLAACTPSNDTPEVAAADEHVEEDDHHEDDDHHEEDGGTDDHHEDEHGDMEHMHADVPHEYEGLENPLAEDETAVTAGKATFDVSCATCHGAEGHGDGAAAEALDPKPADLSDGMMMMDLGDDYLFWRINEGGVTEPFNSAMPAWKAALSQEQIWQVVSYVRTLEK